MKSKKLPIQAVIRQGRLELAKVSDSVWTAAPSDFDPRSYAFWGVLRNRGGLSSAIPSYSPHQRSGVEREVAEFAAWAQQNLGRLLDALERKSKKPKKRKGAAK